MRRFEEVLLEILRFIGLYLDYSQDIETNKKEKNMRKRYGIEYIQFGMQLQFEGIWRIIDRVFDD